MRETEKKEEIGKKRKYKIMNSFSASTKKKESEH